MNTSPSRLFFIFFISIISFININSVYSADTNAVAYFPLKVGNVFVYNVHTRYSAVGNPEINLDTIYVGKILKDTSITGKKYFYFSGFPYFQNNIWYRVDTTSGSLLKFDPLNTCSYYISESFIDSLAALPGNNIKDCGVITQYIIHTCNSLDSFQLFNINTFIKDFYYNFTFHYYSTKIRKYCRNFGLYLYDASSSSWLVSSFFTARLKGCVINGIVYGDTTSYPSYVNIPEFFPLKVGNVFVYKGHFTTDQYSSDSIYKSKIIKDTLISGRKYFKFSGFPFYDNNKWYRIDSATGSLKYYNTSNICSYYNNESFVDSLGAFLGAGIRSCGQIPSNTTHTCTSIDTVKLFSNITYRKEFTYSYSSGPNLLHRIIRYGKKYGPYYRYESSTNPSAHSSTYTLKGCVINGIVSGDTSSSIIGIQPINNNIPKDYTLNQNYPNPFNPNTIIRFALPEACNVILNIYDATGRKVTALIANEYLNAGEYEVNFDGSNLSSGLYFYYIETTHFKQTMKMILIK